MTGILHLVETATTTSVGTQRTQTLNLNYLLVNFLL